MNDFENFGGMLDRLIEHHPSIDRMAFAKLTGISYSQVSEMIHARRTATPGKVIRMADVLGLRGEDRDGFFEAAALTHVPDELRPYFLGILSRIRAASRRRKTDPPTA